MTVSAEDPAAVDFSHQFIFAHARLDSFEDPPVHVFDDARSDAHVSDFLGRLDRPLPVHQPDRVDQLGLRQVFLQRQIRGGAEIIVIHFHADGQRVPTPGTDDFPRQVIHRMAFPGLHVDVRVTDDVLVLHEHRALGAVGVLPATEPDWLAVERQQHALVNVKRPTVIAGQPGHVRRIGDQQQLDALNLHGRSNLGQTLGVFLPFEREIDDYLRHAHAL